MLARYADDPDMVLSRCVYIWKKHEEMSGIAFIALGLNRDEGRNGNEFWHVTLGIKMPSAGVPGMMLQPSQLAERQKTRPVF